MAKKKDGMWDVGEEVSIVRCENGYIVHLPESVIDENSFVFENFEKLSQFLLSHLEAN